MMRKRGSTTWPPSRAMNSSLTSPSWLLIMPYRVLHHNGLSMQHLPDWPAAYAMLASQDSQAVATPCTWSAVCMLHMACSHMACSDRQLTRSADQRSMPTTCIHDSVTVMSAACSSAKQLVHNTRQTGTARPSHNARHITLGHSPPLGKPAQHSHGQS